MKPNFALSLTFEGISLLHRVDGGWHLAGSVALESTELATDMAALRTRAGELDKAELRSKVVLPNEQIKYLTIETGDVESRTRAALVVSALNGATPYDVDDLVFDWSEEGPLTHIAAVARETLEEAEAFALEHDFNPISFVAIPGEDQFTGEPFFGLTQHVQTLPDGMQGFSPDGQKITIIGKSPRKLVPPPADDKAPPQAAQRADDAPDTAEISGDPLPNLGQAQKERRARKEAEAARPDMGAAPAPQPRFNPAAVAATIKPTEDEAAQNDDAPRPDAAPDTPPAAPAFQSRRPEMAAATPVPPAPSASGNAPKIIPAPTAPVRTPDINEAQRMSTFGAHRSEPRPLRLRYIAAAALAAVLIGGGVAWGLFGGGDAESDIAAAPVDSEINDSAVVETTTDRIRPPAVTPREAEARYASTGIWQKAPLPPLEPTETNLDDLYVASIDPPTAAHDAIALPGMQTIDTDGLLNAQNSSQDAGMRFNLDERGLVVATPEGALSPDGVMVYLGRPAVLPERWPERADTPSVDRLASLRPKARPDGLIERTERAAFGGLSRAELAKLRPKARPASLQARQEVDTTPTKEAVKTSLTPRARPKNFAKIVEKSRKESETEVAATPRRAVVNPKIPTTASVARQATVRNAINLKKINLIGVYGKPSARRALVRMSNGRYKKVKVGDRIDGGRVAAIGERELRYIKSGRNVVLKMPKG